MAHCWLLKTEPSTYSFSQLQKDRHTVWDGVKNPLALKHLAGIKKGDDVLIYHTGDEKAVIGVARAVSDPYPDPKKNDPRMLVIELAAERLLPQPVTLAAIKANPRFGAFDLVRLPRLSVMPVSNEQLVEIRKMSDAQVRSNG